MGSVRNGNQYKRIKEKRRAAIDEKRKNERKRTVVKRIVAFVLTIAAVCVVVASCIFVSGKVKDSGVLLRRRAAVSSERNSVDCAMLSVYMYQYYNDYVSANSSSLRFDINLPLKEQSYSTDGKTSWFDYFAGKAVEDASKYLALKESADTAGFTITEAEKTASREKAALLDPADYGRGVNREDIERALELQTIALRYEEELKYSCKPSDETVEKEYSENANSYMTVGFRSYSVIYSDGEKEESDDKSQNQESIYHYPGKADAKLYAEDLALCKNESDFVAWVSKYTSLIVEGTLPEDIEKSVKSTSGYKYSSGDGLSEWAFSSDRAEYDTYIREDEKNSAYTVYMITDPAKKDETPTVNVRHILLTAEYSGLSDQDMNVRLAEIYEKVRASDNKEAAFAENALIYSNDDSSAYNGGLYENLIKGTMPEEFDLWCFDSERQPGDMEVIRTSYGWHLMYYQGEGEPVWKASVSSALQKKAYDEKYEGIKALYNADTNQNNIDKIPE